MSDPIYKEIMMISEKSEKHNLSLSQQNNDYRKGM